MASLPGLPAGGIAYIQAFTAGPSKAIRVMGYINTAVSSVICILFLAGFTIRVRRGTLKWIQPDGALSRPDFQVVIPAIWCLLMTGFIPLHCLLATRKSSQALWAILNVAFYLTQTSICFAAIIVCLAWVARVPSVRRYVESYAERRNTNRKPFSPIVAYVILVLLFSVLFFASTLPQTIKYFRYINDLFGHLAQLLKLFNDFETSGDLSLVPQMLSLANDLMNTAKYVTGTPVKITSAIYTAWAAIWSAIIITSATLLRKSIEVCIASFPVTPNRPRRASVKKPDDLSLPVSPSSAYTNESSATLAFGNSNGTNGHDSYLHKVPSYPALPEDRPFGNIVTRTKTTLHPRHFQSVLDAPTVSPTEKARQLRIMLRKDAYLSGLFLLVLLLSVGSAIFVACGAFNINPSPGHMSAETALMVYYTWGSYAFLLPALPGSINFLLTSLHTSTPLQSRKLPSSSDSITTFSIPLVTTSGIGVQQSCVISDEYAGKGDKLDSDAESLPGLTTVRYT